MNFRFSLLFRASECLKAYVLLLSVVKEQWKLFMLYNLNHHFQDRGREVTDIPVVRAERCYYSIGFTIQIASDEELKNLDHSII